MYRSTGSYELVLSPVILAVAAWFVDGWLGMRPILTIVAAVLGLTGAVVKLVYTYAADMDAHDAEGVWGPRDG